MSSNQAKNPLFAVILAGGSGTRFWPLSRSQYPKQVLRLLGSDSMLQATIARLLPRIPLARLAVVTNASQEEVIRLELYQKGWEEIHLWLEPVGRNTAAAVGLAAVRLLAQEGDPVMAVFPADHYIRDLDRLLQALDIGAAWAEQGYLVTFGLLPSRPETGYGYIKAAEPLDSTGLAYKCAKFMEKPDLATAAGFLAEGNYYWNSGIFMFRRDIILAALARHLPELSQGLKSLKPDYHPEALAEIYPGLPSISLDHGILERADNVVVVPVDMGWSDLGTWGAFLELFPPDESGNVVQGRILDRGSRDCLLYAQDRLVGTIGLNNLIVVDTPDATLICHREQVQEVKDLVAALDRQNCIEARQHATVQRPWGHYTVMDVGLGYKVKQIEVLPGKRLSLQMHRHRAEHWVVVQGEAQVTIGQEVRKVLANESVFVPPMTAHRLENQSAEPLRIIEVQTGPYVEEDDILRLADDFWRVSDKNK